MVGSRAGRGRPRIQETADDIVASVLATAGPRVSTAEYSSRRIAELTGLSQSVVSRSVRRLRRAEVITRTTTDDATLPDALQVDFFAVEYPRIVIRWSRVASDRVAGGKAAGDTAANGGSGTHDATPGPASPGRMPTTSSASAEAMWQRRAAAVMAALWVSGAAAWSAEAPQALGTETLGTRTLGTETLSTETPGSSAGRFTVEWTPGAMPWEDALARTAQLLSHCTHSASAIPADLLTGLAAHVGHGLLGMRWERGEGNDGAASSSFFDSHQLAVAEFPAPARSVDNRWLPGTALSATEQIAVALRKVMMGAGYRVGDRIVPARFAEVLRLSESSVRTAMRQLADDGLLDRVGSGFVIPQISGADVIDLYAARVQVGSVILRGVAGQPRHRLIPVHMALSALEAAARAGSRADVGEADLRFQQELADASGLRQSARSFHALTLRLRMFISVLQLDYAPAVERLVADDRRILQAVVQGRPGDAVRIWRSKLDDAVRHMSALAPDTFDHVMWVQLTR